MNNFHKFQLIGTNTTSPHFITVSTFWERIPKSLGNFRKINNRQKIDRKSTFGCSFYSGSFQCKSRDSDLFSEEVLNVYTTIRSYRVFKLVLVDRALFQIILHINAYRFDITFSLRISVIIIKC